MYNGNILTNDVMYKIIDLGGMLPFYDIIYDNYSLGYTPVEFLVSKKV